MKQSQVHIPVRTCIGCRSKEPQSAFVRIARTSEATLAVEVSGARRRLPGRGAYVHPRTQCVERVERRGVLSRAFRARIAAADEAAVISALHNEAEQRR